MYPCARVILTVPMYTYCGELGDRLLLEHVDQDADLREQLGPPVRISKWYNAMVGVRPGGMAADCSLSLSGMQRDANATIQVQCRKSAAAAQHAMQPDDSRLCHQHKAFTQA
jgi:hypothetical protein